MTPRQRRPASVTERGLARCSTSSAKNAASSASTATPRRPRWPTWVSMPCSIAGRRARASPSSDGVRVRALRQMGYVAEIFTQPALATLPGHVAIGHTRYSTAGESTVANAQPLLIDCVHGQVGICHNGNIVNAREIRDELVRQGSIFQTNSDTEVVLHLFARSQARRRRRRAGRVDRQADRRLLVRVHHQATGWSRRAIRTASGRWRSAASATAGSCAPRPARWIWSAPPTCATSSPARC